MRMELYQGEKMEIRVTIPSLKKSRDFILNLFAKNSNRTHIIYRNYLYTSSDIYAERHGSKAH